MAEPEWGTSESSADLAAGQVHVWRSRLTGEVQDRVELLSEDERRRASRFRYEIHRARFIEARGLLRRLLGGYLDVDPEEIEFAYADHGKPYLEGTDVFFNLSHAGDFAVFAFTRHAKVGIDVEAIDDDLDLRGLARRFFSQAEWVALSSLEANQWPSAFFTIWTRKEAFVKAVGEGLSIPLSDFDVSLSLDPPLIGAIRCSPAEGRPWSMFDLVLPAGFVGAVVVEADDPKLSIFDADGSLVPTVSNRSGKLR